MSAPSRESVSDRATAAEARVGVDVGGTFTDAVILTAENRLAIRKVPTTPSAFATGVFAALDAVAGDAGVAPAAIRHLLHGSTVATNAIVDGSIARAGLLTTAGFRDVLEIGTQQRASLYDLTSRRPPPLVPRALRLEADERIGSAGEVVRPLCVDDVVTAAERFRAERVEAIAIVFLFSFANPSHELQARDVLRELLPDTPVAVSCEVSPEFREYLRTSTTVVNAALLPLVGGYVREVGDGLTRRTSRSPLLMMRSNGGVAPAAYAAEVPVSLIASGPAAGVIGAAGVAARAGRRDLLTFDMGGTTADVALVLDGEPQLAYRGDAAGYPINLPQLDVTSVGAGGGSIASVDAFGSLHVGPESAGAEPGPACYGLGGLYPTVTDAHVVLGMLPAGRILGGAIVVDAVAALAAIEEHVGQPLGCNPIEAAGAILRLANATMAGALRVVSVARGHDARELTLVAYGGAGPMHAAALADELGITEILVPPAPGATSALGLLLSDVRYELSSPWTGPDRTVAAAGLGDILRRVRAQGEERLSRSGLAGDGGRVELALDLRYRGQAYELTIPLAEDGADLDRRGITRTVERFHETHRAIYGHALTDREVEVVTVRGRAVAPVAERSVVLERGAEAAAAQAREIYAPDGTRRLYTATTRRELDLELPIPGPLVLDEPDTTVVVPDGWAACRGVSDTVTLQRLDTTR